MDPSNKAYFELYKSYGASTACLDEWKGLYCSQCEPSNQKYISGSNGADFVVCKAQCLKIKTACAGLSGTPYATTSCDNLPETDCWNAASSAQASIVAIVALLSVVLALF